MMEQVRDFPNDNDELTLFTLSLSPLERVRRLEAIMAEVFNVWEQNTRSTVDRDAYWQRGEQGYLWWPAENALVLKD